MELTLNNQMMFKAAGHYNITTINKETGRKVKDKCFYNKNVVTYDGIDYLFTRSTFRSDGASATMDISFGTGTSEILVTDTTLGGTTISKGGSFVATTPESVDAINKVAKSFIKRRAVYSPGEATGTYGQVGMTGGSTLYAGQVLRDTSGNPTTVTFLDIEEVTVEYTVELTYTYLDSDESLDYLVPSGTVILSVDGNDHTCTFHAYPNWLSGNSTHNVLNTPNTAMETHFSNSSHTNYGMRVWMNSAPSVSSPPEDFNWVYYTKYNKHPSVEVLQKGVQYKKSITLTVPYTENQDVAINHLFIGHSGSQVALGRYMGNSMGSVTIDPPIFKSAGYELTFTVHVIYELV